MRSNKYTIYNSEEYDEWLEEQPLKCQLQILERISHIREDGHFGVHKDVGGGVWELK